MKISTKGRYALRMMVDLAEHDDGEYIRLKDIAIRQEITLKYLEQIIPQLTRSCRGNNGGYMLTRGPEEYTVGEIIRALEGSLAPVACITDNPNRCPRQEECATLEFWEGLWRVVNEYMDGVTLADLMEKHVCRTRQDEEGRDAGLVRDTKTI